MVYIANSFSLQMLPYDSSPIVDSLSVSKVKKYLEGIINTDITKSIVGHSDIAKIISTQLGFEVPMNRESISLDKYDIMYVAQYFGPRLPEGTTVLPDDATIQWYKVNIIPNQKIRIE